MKKIGILMLLLLSGFWVKGQNVAEVFVNDRNVSHEIWLDGRFSDSSRFSVFNYTRFRVDYRQIADNEFLSYSTFNYAISRKFSIASGGFLTNAGFVPVIAASYFYQNDTWLVNLFPSVELTEDSNMEIFFIFQFQPRINDELRFFSRLMLNSNFDFQQHNFSEQNLRIGLEYQGFQFGLGSDFTQLPTYNEEEMVSTTTLNVNLGIFLRKEF